MHECKESVQQNLPQVVTLGAIELHNITQSRIQPHSNAFLRNTIYVICKIKVL